MELKRNCNLRMEIMELVAWWEGAGGTGSCWKEGTGGRERGSWRAGGRKVKKQRKDGGSCREGAGGRGLLRDEGLEVSKETWNWRD